MHLLEVNHLSGGYQHREILKDLTFSLEKGEIVGLIGLNGAGKSTTMKHIIGLLQPIKGDIRLNGATLAEDAATYHRSLSYVPELPILYDTLTLREHIEMIGKVYGLSADETMQRAQPLLDQFRLTERLEWLPAHFSKGMKQKVMIICSMMLDTALYVVDEPFVGLDPLAIADFTDILLEKRASGHSVLLSTHILANAERYCDRFIFLKEGQISAMGTLDEIRSQWDLDGASLEDIYLALARGTVA
ncbi:MAG: ABC transporter ATP-binding protein [Aerococcus sp.]|nr:ABC transporter ATP-binding protein [Aerococcus sp.]